MLRSGGTQSSASRDDLSRASSSMGERATPLTPERSSETYARHLLLKKRGFPLWIPGPNNNLPTAYRRIGINIGDVGIITQSGAFSFLFNICQASDSPINPRILPEQFCTLSPSIDPVDILEWNEFEPGSYLASASIERSQSNSSS